MDNRRNVLKSIGTAAVGAFGLSFLGKKAEAVAPKREVFEKETEPKKYLFVIEDQKEGITLMETMTKEKIIDFVSHISHLEEADRRWAYPVHLKNLDYFFSGQDCYSFYLISTYDKNGFPDKKMFIIDYTREQRIEMSKGEDGVLRMYPIRLIREGKI